jgi:hypothetical protein
VTAAPFTATAGFAAIQLKACQKRRNERTFPGLVPTELTAYRFVSQGRKSSPDEFHRFSRAAGPSEQLRNSRMSSTPSCINSRRSLASASAMCRESANVPAVEILESA